MSTLISIFKEVIYLGATASILILIILLVKKIFKKVLSPKWHYYIWMLLILRLLIPFSPESSVSIYSLLNKAADKVNLSVSEISIGNIVKTTKALPIVVENGNNEKTTASDIASNNIDTTLIKKESPKYDFAVMIAASIWGIGVILFSIYIIYINTAFTVDLNKRYTLLKDKRINDILEDCKRVMRIKRAIPLLTSKKARTPALYGFISAKILVSEEYIEKLNDAEIEYIFLHELSHYKRKDIIINWILALLQIVYFFNPLIWYAFYKIHEDCEISCDAAALRYVNEDEYFSYGSTIIKLIKLYSESNFIPITAGISKNKSSYERRIIMISKFRKSKWTNTLLALVLIISVGLTGLTGCKISTNKESNNNTGALSNSPVNTEGKDTSKTPEVQQETNNQGDAETDKPSENNNTENSAKPSEGNTAGDSGVRNNSSNTGTKNASQEELLKDMMKLAQQGKIINSEFAVKTTDIGKIEKKLGKADKVDWISEAKGNYVAYPKYNLAFGFNKGSQVFEARSFDSKLKSISLSMVKKTYGTPAYDVKVKGEEIIGYTAGQEFKILLVFKEPSSSNKNPYLDHYSVLYPRGTVNMMADDPGREW